MKKNRTTSNFHNPSYKARTFLRKKILNAEARKKMAQYSSSGTNIISTDSNRIPRETGSSFLVRRTEEKEEMVKIDDMADTNHSFSKATPFKITKQSKSESNITQGEFSAARGIRMEYFKNIMEGRSELNEKYRKASILKLSYLAESSRDNIDAWEDDTNISSIIRRCLLSNEKVEEARESEEIINDAIKGMRLKLDGTTKRLELFTNSFKKMDLGNKKVVIFKRSGFGSIDDSEWKSGSRQSSIGKGLSSSKFKDFILSIKKAVDIHNKEKREEEIGLFSIAQKSSARGKSERRMINSLVSNEERVPSQKGRKVQGELDDSNVRSTIISAFESTVKPLKSVAEREKIKIRDLDLLTSRCNHIINQVSDFNKVSHRQVGLIEKRLLLQENNLLFTAQQKEDELMKGFRRRQNITGRSLTNRTTDKSSLGLTGRMSRLDKSRCQSFTSRFERNSSKSESSTLNKDFKEHAQFYSRLFNMYRAQVGLLIPFILNAFKDILEYHRLLISEGACFNYTDVKNVVAYLKSLRLEKLKAPEREFLRVILIFYRDQTGIAEEDYFQQLPFYHYLI